VYSTCLYCNGHLGANEVIEAFPVGRRLAFDQARGRLWVVCRKCEKWNLTPFEERWEAIEDCERRFCDARKRVSSDNIGLAKLNEGLELVRIGEPLRPEFAAWRYGDQFGRRRRRTILIGAGAVAVGGGILVAGAVTAGLSGGGYGIWQAVQWGYAAVKRRRLAARVTSPTGERLTVRGRHLEKASLIAPPEGESGWGLLLPNEQGPPISFHGENARRTTALLMPKVNSGGASRRRVQEAVQRLEAVGDPTIYMQHLANMKPPPSRKPRASNSSLLTKLDLETRLAVEMAVNEENERIALAGELALLELEWKEAEELAAIADRLGLPDEVDRQLEDMRKRVAPDQP